MARMVPVRSGRAAGWPTAGGQRVRRDGHGRHGRPDHLRRGSATPGRGRFAVGSSSECSMGSIRDRKRLSLRYGRLRRHPVRPAGTDALASGPLGPHRPATSLRLLAEQTDGAAIANLEAHRVGSRLVQDLTSYYLVSYHRPTPGRTVGSTRRRHCETARRNGSSPSWLSRGTAGELERQRSAAALAGQTCGALGACRRHWRACSRCGRRCPSGRAWRTRLQAQATCGCGPSPRLTRRRRAKARGLAVARSNGPQRRRQPGAIVGRRRACWRSAGGRAGPGRGGSAGDQRVASRALTAVWRRWR